MAAQPPMNPDEQSKGTACSNQVRARWRVFLTVLTGIVFVVGTILVLLNAAQIKDLLRQVDQAKAWVIDQGLLKASLIFFIANTVICTFGFPRFWTGVFAGIVFGGPLGFSISLPSSLLGAYFTFLAFRMMGSRKLFEKLRAKGLSHYNILDKEPKLIHVILIRQIPVPGFLSTAILAASKLRGMVFLGGTAIGFVPAAAIGSFLGGSVTSEHSTLSVTITSVVVVVCVLMTIWMRRQISRHFVQNR